MPICYPRARLTTVAQHPNKPEAPGSYEVIVQGQEQRMLVRTCNLCRAQSVDYSGLFVFNKLPQVASPRSAVNEAAAAVPGE